MIKNLNKNIITKFKSNIPIIAFFAVIVFAMLVNVFHPYLWGPDEPRVAELGREVFVTGNFITPHICGVPFVEKPPLFFDLIAGSYWLTGGPSPGAARIISALFGLLMLGCTFWFSRHWKKNSLAGVFAVMFLICMPQFYRITHMIVVDPGVGGFCVLALVIFAYYAFWDGSKNRRWPLYLFYISCAGAFLTKGVFCLFYIGLVSGAFILFARRWELIRKFLSPLPMLVFFIPVLLWAILFYVDAGRGGMYYFYQLFVNNTIGRFIHINMTLPGDSLKIVDVGIISPWYFYLQRAISMFGIALLFIPFIIIDGLRNWPITSKVCDLLAHRLFRKHGKLILIIKRFLSIIFGEKQKVDNIENIKNRDIKLFVILWAFLPIFLLSFSVIKEITYIIPSYAAMAILVGNWLYERLQSNSNFDFHLRDSYSYMYVVIPVILIAVLVPFLSLYVYLSLFILVMLFGLIIFIKYLKIREYSKIIFLVLAFVLSGVLIGNTPPLMMKTHLGKRCFYGLSKYVWKEVGSKKLYVYMLEETLYGSIPFYGNRTTPLITDYGGLNKVLNSPKESYVIVSRGLLKEFKESSSIYDRTLKHCRLIYLPFNDLVNKYLLIHNRRT